MKNLIILFVLLIFGMEMSAQEYIINLKMNPKVSPYIDEWKSGNIDGELQIINNSLEAKEVIIGTELFYNDILVASNNLELSENSIFLETGLNIIEAEGFLENLIFDDVMLSKKESTYFNRTKRLPAGNYEICIRLLDAQTQDLLPGVIPNNPFCFPAIIMSYFPPTLVFPEDNTLIRSAEVSTTTFQWTSIVPFCKDEVFYEIKVYEWLPDQTQEQAALVNVPVWSTKTTETQAIFDFACLPWDDTQTFVWQVQAMDEEEISIGENDGYSEVWGFGETKGDELLLMNNDIGAMTLAELLLINELVPWDDNKDGHAVDDGGLGGLGTDFGVISWGTRGHGHKSASNACFFSPSNDSIEINYTYYIEADCSGMNPIATIDIQTLAYKNCDLLDSSGTGLNVAMSYKVNGTNSGTGNVISISPNMYKVPIRKLKIDDYSTGNPIQKTGSNCVASVDVRMVIYDVGISSNDIYYLASSIYNHTPIGTNPSVFPINVDYSKGYPSLGELKGIKARLGTEESHININPIPVKGTRSCDVFLETANDIICKSKAALEEREKEMDGNGLLQPK